MRAAAAVVVILGLVSALAGVAVAVLAFEPIPFADSIDFFRRFFEVGGWEGYGLGELYARHNEHRLVVPRLWFLLDLALFQGTQAFLIVVTVLSSLAHAAVLAWVFRCLEHRSAMLWAFAAAALGATLSPAQWENLVWSFQVQFIQVWLFASLAFVAVALGGAPASWTRLALAIVCGLASSYSMANGILVWPLLVALALWRGVRGGPLWLLLVAAVTVIGVEVANYHAHAGHGDPLQTIRQPIALARYALRYLTSGVAVIGNLGQELLGGALVAAWGAFAMRALLRRDRHAPAHGVLIAVAGFVIGAALLTALGRVTFGLGQANSVRYATPSFVFMLAVLGLLLDRLSRVERPKVVSLGMVAGAAVLLVPGLVDGAKHLPAVLDQRDNRANAIIAYLAGGYRPETLGAIFPHVKMMAFRVLEELDRRNLGPFADRSRYQLPAAVRGADLAVPAGPCRGHVDLAKSDPEAGLQLSGWLAAPDTASQPGWIAVADQTGRIVAWGASRVPRPDVGKAIGRGAFGRGFDAFGPKPADGPLRVFGVLDDGQLCRLPGEVAAPLPRPAG